MTTTTNMSPTATRTMTTATSSDSRRDAIAAGEADRPNAANARAPRPSERSGRERADRERATPDRSDRDRPARRRRRAAASAPLRPRCDVTDGGESASRSACCRPRSVRPRADAEDEAPRRAAACASRATTTAARSLRPPERHVRLNSRAAGRRSAALFRARQATDAAVTKVQQSSHERVAAPILVESVGGQGCPPKGTLIMTSKIHSMLAAAATMRSPFRPSPMRAAMRAVGSSTVYPFAKAVAERVARANPQARHADHRIDRHRRRLQAVLLRASASAFPTFRNASRRMKASEAKQCAANGVKDVTEIQVGLDGVALATAQGHRPFGPDPARHLSGAGQDAVRQAQQRQDLEGRQRQAAGDSDPRLRPAADQRHARLARTN